METAVLTGNNVPTHVQGGRLGYVTLINMPTFTAETLTSRCLLNDHFVLETTIPIQPVPTVLRKRLAVPAARMSRLVAHVEAWYSAAKGSFPNAASLYQGLVDTIEGFVAVGRAPQKTAKRCLRTYATNPAVTNCQWILALYQRHWQQDPDDQDAQDAMVTMA